ncbi:MAG: hypothetical protein LBQ48_01040 [Oscillospiraceae bacterium]|nr:hypothetical protein [Oscillospiraceae bacterium]
MKNQRLLSKTRETLRKGWSNSGTLWRHSGGGLTLALKIVFFCAIAFEGFLDVILALARLLDIDPERYNAEKVAEAQRSSAYMGIAALLAVTAIVLMIFKKYIPAAVTALTSGAMSFPHFLANWNPQRLEPLKWYEGFAIRHTVPTAAFCAAAAAIAVIYSLDLAAENREYAVALDKIYKSKLKKGDILTNEQWSELVNELYPE